MEGTLSVSSSTNLVRILKRPLDLRDCCGPMPNPSSGVEIERRRAGPSGTDPDKNADVFGTKGYKKTPSSRNQHLAPG